MAAQSEGEKIPAKQNTDLYIQVDNGKHELQIRQLFDPGNYELENEGEVNFEIVVDADTKSQIQQIENVFWLTG
jgi:hypothetical protein